MALQAGVVAGWALLWPRSFFTDFPVIGGAWVADFPPYNEHLVRDVGALYLGFVVLFLSAASSLEITLVRAALISWLPFALIHLYFHIAHLGRMSGTEKVLQTTALALVVLIPILLLRSMTRRSASGFSRRPRRL
jgi:hypothetical protein